MSRASTPSLAAAASSSPSPSSPSPSSRGGGDHRGHHHHHPPRRFATTPLTGVRDLVREGKTIWLLDQFGVLHDGKTAYPAAIHATKRLYDAGAKLYVISNSSRRSAKTLAKLEPMGFDPAWFAGAITSGEMTWRALEARDAFEGSAEADARGPKPFAGDKVLHFTWSERGSIALDGLGLTTVTSPDDADFIVAHGTEAVNGAGDTDAQRAAGIELKAMEDMRGLLRRAARRNIPMMVANPDYVTVGGEGGALMKMPGTLARWYEEALESESESDGEGEDGTPTGTGTGGVVHLMGKPNKIIYDEVFRMASDGGGGARRTISMENVVAVGDSLEHDVIGAQNAGCDVVFVCGGIHADDLGMDPAALTGDGVGDGAAVPFPPAEAIERVARAHDAAPTYAVPVFKW